MTTFKKQIKRINPGRKIDVNKLTDINDEAWDTLYIRKSYGSAGRCLIK